MVSATWLPMFLNFESTERGPFALKITNLMCDIFLNNRLKFSAYRLKKVCNINTLLK